MKEFYNKHKNIINAVILLAYVAFHIFLISRHESWRDEAQAWTLASNSTMGELFADLCVEGHPCLWFLIIKFFRLFSLPYTGFALISMLFMTAAVALLLWKSPFSPLMKLVILCSSMFLYWTAVIPRTYCVITLLVVLLAINREQMKDRPFLYGILVALVFQSHIIMAGFAGGLMLEMFYEAISKKNEKPLRRRMLGASCIPLVSMAGTFFELYQRSDAPKTVDASVGGILASVSQKNILFEINDLEETLWGEAVCNAELLGKTGKSLILLALFVIFLALLLSLLLKKSFVKNLGILFVSFCGIGFFLGVRILVYNGGYHMTMCLLLMTLYLVWTLCRANGEKSLLISSQALLAFVLVLTYSGVFSAIRFDIDKEFSCGYQTAEYMEENLPEGSVVLFCEGYTIPSVYAYADSFAKDIPFISVDTGEPFKFYVWGAEYGRKTTADIVRFAEGLDTEDVYYLFPVYPDSVDSPEDLTGLELVYSADRSNPFDENYKLYKINLGV